MNFIRFYIYILFNVLYILFSTVRFPWLISISKNEKHGASQETGRNFLFRVAVWKYQYLKSAKHARYFSLRRDSVGFHYKLGHDRLEHGACKEDLNHMYDKNKNFFLKYSPLLIC